MCTKGVHWLEICPQGAWVNSKCTFAKKCLKHALYPQKSLLAKSVKMYMVATFFMLYCLSYNCLFVSNLGLAGASKVSTFIEIMKIVPNRTFFSSAICGEGDDAQDIRTIRGWSDMFQCKC